MKKLLIANIVLLIINLISIYHDYSVHHYGMLVGNSFVAGLLTMTLISHGIIEGYRKIIDDYEKLYDYVINRIEGKS